MKSSGNQTYKLTEPLVVATGAGLSLLIGLDSLMGWTIGFHPLQRLESIIPMAPSTALLFVVFSAILLVSSHYRKSVRIYRTALTLSVAGTILALSLFILSAQNIYLEAEYFGRQPVEPVNGVPVGHMSPVTAFCFLLTGISLILGHRDARKRIRARWVSFWLAGVLLLFSYILLVAYFFGTPVLYGTPLIPPAFTTSLAFFGLGWALLTRSGYLLWLHYEPEQEVSRTYFAILILVAVLFSGAIVSSGYYYFRNQAERYREEVVDHLTGINDMKVRTLSEWYRERTADARIFYRNTNFSHRMEALLQNPGDQTNRGRIRQWMHQVGESSQYNNVCLYDQAGNLLQSIHPSVSMENPLFRACFRETAEAAEAAAIRQVDFYRTGDSLFMDFLIPVFDEATASVVIGVLDFRIDPRLHLFPVLHHWPIPGEPVETILLTQQDDGQFTVFTDSVGCEGTPFLHILAERVTLHSREPGANPYPMVFETGVQTDAPCLFYVNRIAGTHWFLAARIPTSHFTSQMMNRFLELMLLLILLIMGAAVGIGALWRSQQIRHLRGKLHSAEALQASELRYRSLLDHMMEGCQILGHNWEYLYINEAGAKMGRKTREELMGSTVLEQYPGVEGSPVFVFLQDCMTQRKQAREDIFFSLPDGDKRWVTFAVQPVPEGIFVLTLDITGQKKREIEMIALNEELERRVNERTRQLQSLNEEMEAFVYSVSHDLKAPLRTINGYTAMLRDKAGEGQDDEFHRLISVILSGTGKMEQLINDLLALSRVVRKEIRSVPVNMNELAGEVLAELTETALRPDLSVEKTPLPDAVGDPGLLKQVWVNLISNALKYTRQASPAIIRISGETREGFHIYSIRDNGVGFNPEYTHKLFKAFQRLHSSPEYEGTGIGLAIVHRIITRHGGTITATSKPGEGAEFTFTLPVRG